MDENKKNEQKKHYWYVPNESRNNGLKYIRDEQKGEEENTNITKETNTLKKEEWFEIWIIEQIKCSNNPLRESNNTFNYPRNT